MMMDQAEGETVELEGDSTSLINRAVKQEPQWSIEEELHMGSFPAEPPPFKESSELPVSSELHGLGTTNTDQMNTAHGRSSLDMKDQVRKDSGDPSVDFVVKLEPAWSMEDDPPDQPSAVYSPGQPMSDNTSGSLLDRSHVCHHCFATFVLVSSLELHVASVHGEEMYVVLPVASSPDGCEAGDYSSPNLGFVSNLNGWKAVDKTQDGVDSNDADRDGDLKEEELVSACQKRFKCETCNKTFTRAHCLKVHKLIHTGLKPFKCDVCGRAFIRYTLLKSHRLTHTSLNPHVCDVCGKAFTKGDHLKIHKRIHTGERPYKCPHCSADFKASCQLKRHVLTIHAGEKPYVCRFCGMGFAVNGHLQRHERIHTGEKPFTCEMCGTDFTQASHLKKHQRIHTDKKPHVCDVCGATFAKACILKRHEVVHELNHFTCTDCGKTFTRSNALKCHRLIHTGEKPHSCPHCPTTFTQSGSLKRHVQNQHPFC